MAHRADTSTVAASLPTPSPAGTPGYFTGGDPAVPIPATVPGADFFNMIQEEIVGTVEKAGITPDQTKADYSQLYKALRALSSPAGQVITFAGATAPDNYLECNGAAVSRTTYADLFAVIGTTYGAGNGSTTFNLPDLRGEFVRGWDNSRGVDASRTLGSAQKGTIAAIDHTNPAVWAISSNATVEADARVAAGADDFSASDYTGMTISAVAATSSSNALKGHVEGSSGVTRPRNIAMMHCIKT